MTYILLPFLGMIQWILFNQYTFPEVDYAWYTLPALMAGVVFATASGRLSQVSAWQKYPTLVVVIFGLGSALPAFAGRMAPDYPEANGFAGMSILGTIFYPVALLISVMWLEDRNRQRPN